MALYTNTTIIRNDGTIIACNNLYICIQNQVRNAPLTCFNPKTNKVKQNKVIISELEGFLDQCLQITLNKKYQILCTFEQEFLLSDKTFVPGFNLNIGDELLTYYIPGIITPIEDKKHIIKEFRKATQVKTNLAVRRYRKTDTMTYREIKRNAMRIKTKSIKSHIDAMMTYNDEPLATCNSGHATSNYIITDVQIIDLILKEAFYNIYTEESNYFIHINSKIGIFTKTK